VRVVYTYEMQLSRLSALLHGGVIDYRVSTNAVFFHVYEFASMLVVFTVLIRVCVRHASVHSQYPVLFLYLAHPHSISVFMFFVFYLLSC
jgi:hypothetical protein